MTDKEQYEILKLRKLSQDYYRMKGEGRPTKKDRREMDDFMTVDGENTMMDDEEWDLFFTQNSEKDDSE
jgi:ribosome-associated heat shock protein Hsp15